MCVIQLVITLALIVGISVASYYLPPWATLLLLIVLLLATAMILRYFGGRMIAHFIVGLVAKKGQVLRGATATIHSVKAVPAPGGRHTNSDESGVTPTDASSVDADPDDPENQPLGEEEKSLDYYEIQATITPAPSAGTFNYWDIDDLLLVDFDTVVKPSVEGHEVEGFTVWSIKVWQDGGYVDPDASKLTGEQKVCLVTGVKPGTRRVKFNYYFETFGDIPLPDPVIKN